MKILAAILILTAILLCWHLGRPAFPSFDEGVYPFAGIALSQGNNTEISHPPLGKMLMWESIRFHGDNFVSYRIPSVVAGLLLVLAIWTWTFQLTGNRIEAHLAAGLSVCNCLLFTLSRTGTLDAMSTALLFWAIVSLTAVLKSPRAWYSVALGFTFGLTMGVKWIAVIPIAVAGCVLVYRRQIRDALIAAGTCLLTYAVIFMELANWTKEHFSMIWLWNQQKQIIFGHVGHIGPNYEVSHWWQWPLSTNPQTFVFGKTIAVILLGNPIIMWGGLIALVWIAYNLWREGTFDRWAILAAYLVLYGQYAVMPLKTEFYHYYFAPAMVLGPALVIALRGKKWAWIVYGLAAWSFFLAYPAMTAMAGGRWLSWL